MRQFIASENPDKKGLLSIGGKDYKYLRNVLRLKSRDMISVRLPDGKLQNFTVCKINEENRIITLQICADTTISFENAEITRGVKAGQIQAESCFSEIDFVLFQYIAKPVKMEMIIRQAVECGVKYIVPVIGEFSQKSSIISMQSGKTERIERIIREARQQSGSPVETEVLKPLTNEEAVMFWKKECENLSEDEKAQVVLWERTEETKTLDIVLKSKNLKKICIAVGCEGGISSDEVKFLENSGFNPIHFAGNILRCETAALYGIAAVQTKVFENKNR